jgi:PAS domain S-box-containing protein
MDRTVSGALRRIIMLTASCALVLACIAFAAADFVSSRESLQNDLSTLASIIGSNSEAALMFADRETGVQTLSALHAKPSVVAACIYTASGQPFAEYRTTPRPLHPATAPPAGIRFRHRRLEVTQNIVLNDETIGRLFIAADARDLIARMKRYGLVALTILVASLLVALALSSRLQRILAMPILDLATLADRVRRDRDYSLRAVAHGSRTAREIELLTCAFNDMLAEIQSRDGELQRHRDHLESEVASRTVELRVANDELVEARDAAERIADQNERLGLHKQRILNTVAEGLFELDARGTVTFINHAAATMLEDTPEALIGKSLHTMIHAEPGPPVPLEQCDICSSVLPQPMRVGRGVRFAARSGKTFPVDFTTGATPSESGAAGVVVTFRDITEQLVVERMKDEFVSTVSHELRTPLTSIRGALGLLGSGLIGAMTERAHRMLGIALTNTDRLVRLINDILDLEKMSAGRVELHRKPVAASVLMKEAVDVIQNLADEAGVAVTCASDDAVLRVDPDRIVQTLTNLLGNAVKFSPAGTTVRLSGSLQGNSFVFRISDEGRGIPAEKLDSIFERFQQVDASDSRDKGGSGLGLAISRSNVAAHGGRIWVESEVGKGSTFQFTAPLAVSPAPKPSDELPAALAAAWGAHPILLVEDDPDLARVIAASLEEKGLVTICAATGAEAMRLCANVVPALVIMDIGLPDMDGYAVVGKMRGTPALARVPLLVYTASELDASDQERLRLGATAFLTKTREPLSTLIGRALSLARNEPWEVAGAA